MTVCTWPETVPGEMMGSARSTTTCLDGLVCDGQPSGGTYGVVASHLEESTD